MGAYDNDFYASAMEQAALLQPARRTCSLRLTSAEQRNWVLGDLGDSPSLRGLLPDIRREPMDPRPGP